MIIYHQNNRGAFARNRIFYWFGQPLLHSRISITSAAAPVIDVTQQTVRGVIAGVGKMVGR